MDNKEINQYYLPDEKIKKIMDDNTEVEVHYKDKVYFFNKKTNRIDDQQHQIRQSIIPSIIASIAVLVYLMYNHIEEIPLSGNISLSSIVTIVGTVMGTLVFSYHLIKDKINKVSNVDHIMWRNIPTMIFAFLMILVIMISSFFWLIGQIFEGAGFDLYTTTAIAAIFLTMINYLMILAVASINDVMMTSLLIFVSVGGIGMSMMSNSTQSWWKVNFSYLGTANAINSWQFNITLIVSALLLATLVDYLFVPLESIYKNDKKLLLLRILLTLTAISLGAVGFFPNNGKGMLHELHNFSAKMLVYWVVIIVVLIRWLLPNVTKEFLILSYIIAGALLVGNFLFQPVGYLSLTAFELIAFFLAFSWVLLLIQNIRKLNSKEPIKIVILDKE